MIGCGARERYTSIVNSDLRTMHLSRDYAANCAIGDSEAVFSEEGRGLQQEGCYSTTLVGKYAAMSLLDLPTSQTAKGVCSIIFSETKQNSSLEVKSGDRPLTYAISLLNNACPK